MDLRALVRQSTRWTKVDSLDSPQSFGSAVCERGFVNSKRIIEDRGPVRVPRSVEWYPYILCIIWLLGAV